MKVEVICKESNLGEMPGISLLNYEAAIRDAFSLWDYGEGYTGKAFCHSMG